MECVCVCVCVRERERLWDRWLSHFQGWGLFQSTKMWVHFINWVLIIFTWSHSVRQWHRRSGCSQLRVSVNDYRTDLDLSAAHFKTQQSWKTDQQSSELWGHTISGWTSPRFFIFTTTVFDSRTTEGSALSVRNFPLVCHTVTITGSCPVYPVWSVEHWGSLKRALLWGSSGKLSCRPWWPIGSLQLYKILGNHWSAIEHRDVQQANQDNQKLVGPGCSFVAALWFMSHLVKFRHKTTWLRLEKVHFAPGAAFNSLTTLYQCKSCQ